MSTGMNIGVGDVARKIKEMYLGIGDVARKVTKGYVGIGGLARLFYSASDGGGVLTYYGRATSLSVARFLSRAARVGDFLLILGGCADIAGYASTAVDAYNKTLVKSIPTSLSYMTMWHAATRLRGYAICGGGIPDSFASPVDTVNGYDELLTRSIPTSLQRAKSYTGATYIDEGTSDYALFMGGGGFGFFDPGVVYYDIDIYDGQLVKLTSAVLSEGKGRPTCATNGSFAFCAGGQIGSTTFSSLIDVINSSLSKMSPLSLTQACFETASARLGDYTIFAGGYKGTSSFVDKVDIINSSLVKLTPLSLSVARNSIIAEAVGDCAMLIGGRVVSGGSSAYTSMIEVISSDLVLTSFAPLDRTLRWAGVGTIDNYLIVAGGDVAPTTATGIVDVFTV